MRKSRLAIVAIACFVLGCIFTAVVATVPPPVVDGSGKGRQTFSRVYQLINQHHLGPPVTDDQLFYGAANGLIEGLDDPFSHFYDPAEAVRTNEEMKGSFGGIGIMFDGTAGELIVHDVVPGAPAQKGGLKPGDTLEAIDGMPTKDLDLEKQIARMRGDVGTTVKLLVRRKDASPFTVTLKREVIKTPSVKWKMLPDSTVSYVRISAFHADTGQLFEKAIDDLKEHRATGMVLDLRDNGGGQVQAAKDVVCSFYLGKPFLVTQKKDGSRVSSLCDDISTPLRDLPVVVLINGHSASASEITAGALRDVVGAKIVGKKSFGKGVGQNVYPLPDGSMAVITAFEWLTPSGKSIHKVGIMPDKEVELGKEDLAAGKDPQLDAALQCLKGNCVP